MQNIELRGEKSIVDKLNFGRKTARRVFWEAFEFTVIGPGRVRVTNASYGHLADEHAYVVDVERQGDCGVPARCECPADEYNEEYDCKHKVALASKGGSVVLDAAIAYEPDGEIPATERQERARTDGGLPEPKAECDCSALGDLPCWPCYLAQEMDE